MFTSTLRSLLFQLCGLVSSALSIVSPEQISHDTLTEGFIFFNLLRGNSLNLECVFFQVFFVEAVSLVCCGMKLKSKPV